MRKPASFRGPVGFTVAESKLAAGLGVLVLVAAAVVGYQRLTQPASQVHFEELALPAGEGQREPQFAEAQLRAHQPRAVLDSSRSAAGRLNINTADYADLVKLPGIGPTLASRILEYRERHGSFLSVDSLVNVSGIGPKKLDRIRPFLVAP